MLVDAGLAFPTVDMIGVDLVLPKLNYLVENKHKIRGMIVTHGHEDHIGGIVPMLKEIDIPIFYAPPLAAALMKQKIKDARIDEQKIKIIEPRETVKVGSSFAVTYVRNNHSIADSFSLIIRTPAGTIVHSGDFKFDHTPIENLYFDVASLAKAGEEGVTLLLSDSTNAEKSSYTPSEKAVISVLEAHFKKATTRILVTTFASQVYRVKLILEIAQRLGKRVAIMGRSMINLTAVSKEIGFMSIPDNFLVRPEDVNKVPPEDLIILTTGSQGEQFAALSRIARNEHKHIKIESGDLVLVSASPIPGNEKGVHRMIDNLFKLGADVIYGREEGIHVSGHASNEEQKILLNLTSPDYFMPCHGEYRMLLKHGQVGVNTGVDPENVFLMDNGDVLQLQDGKCKLVDKVEAGIVMVDNAQVGDLDGHILLARRQLAQEGLLSVIATVNSRGDLLSEPTVYSRGLVMANKDLLNNFVSLIKEATIKSISESTHHGNIDLLQVDVRSEVHKLVDDKLHRHPLMEIMVLEGTGSAAPRVMGLEPIGAG